MISDLERFLQLPKGASAKRVIDLVAHLLHLLLEEVVRLVIELPLELVHAPRARRVVLLTLSRLEEAEDVSLHLVVVLCVAPAFVELVAGAPVTLGILVLDVLVDLFVADEEVSLRPSPVHRVHVCNGFLLLAVECGDLCLALVLFHNPSGVHIVLL